MSAPATIADLWKIVADDPVIRRRTAAERRDIRGAFYVGALFALRARDQRAAEVGEEDAAKWVAEREREIVAVLKEIG